MASCVQARTCYSLAMLGRNSSITASSAASSSGIFSKRFAPLKVAAFKNDVGCYVVKLFFFARLFGGVCFRTPFRIPAFGTMLLELRLIFS